ARGDLRRAEPDRRRLRGAAGDHLPPRGRRALHARGRDRPRRRRPRHGARAVADPVRAGPGLDALALGGRGRRRRDQGRRGQTDPDRDPDEQLVRPLPGRRPAQGETARLRPRAVRRGDRPHRHRGGEAPRARLPDRAVARMAAPVLIAVDRDPEVAAEVERQLVQRYGNEYRVVAHSDPDEALGRLTELRDAGDDVALVFAGPTSTTTNRGELFEDVRRLHPHAKRALLVPPYAWADEPTAAAIRAAMALGRIDHYVLRPVASPDEVFHEAVSDFLLEWARERRLVPQTVHIVGAEWSGRAFELREVFTR